MKDSPYPKPAPTVYAIHDLIRYRWSPRSFADKPIDRDSQRILFEAARWSASCFNDQPWYFITADRDDDEQYNTMLKCLMEGNQSWAGKAPLLVMSVARTHFQHNSMPNRHALHDVGIAIADLTMQATAMGIGMHQMAGFHYDLACETFAIPEGYEPVVICALGYPGEPDELPEALAEKERKARVRKPLSEFVFSGQWGQANFAEDD